MFRYPTPQHPTEAGYAIAGDRFAILISGIGVDDLIAGLWDAAAAESSLLEDVLSVIVAVGIHALPDFAVVEFSDEASPAMRVAVRGAAVIETASGRTVEGRDARTWTETSLADVDGIRLILDGAGASAGVLPLGLGVARANALAWGRPSAPPPTGRVEGVPTTPDLRDVPDAAERRDEAVAEPPGAGPSLRSRAARRAAVGPDESESPPAPRPAARPAHLPVSPAPVSARTPAARAGAAHPDTTPTTLPPAETDAGRRRPHRSAAPDETDVLETLSIDRSLFARPLDDDDFELPAFLTDDTRDADLPDDRTVLGGRRATPAPQAAETYVLRVTPGRDVPLHLPVVLGRGPRPARHPGAQIEVVPSPAKEISGAHLELRLDGDHLIARDLDSTNGTIVRPRESEPLLLRGGATLRVPVGTLFDLGDGVTALFRLAP